MTLDNLSAKEGLGILSIGSFVHFEFNTCDCCMLMQLVHLIVDLLTPNFGVLLAPKLKELQTAEIPESIVRDLTSHTL
jgi:hypothetical protein